DESGLDAMEPLAVVETLSRELEEVLDVLRGVGREELERDLAAFLEGDHGGRRLRGRLVLGERRSDDQQDDHREREQTIHDGTPPTAACAADRRGAGAPPVEAHKRIMMRSSLYMLGRRGIRLAVIRWTDAAARERSQHC